MLVQCMQPLSKVLPSTDCKDAQLFGIESSALPDVAGRAQAKQAAEGGHHQSMSALPFLGQVAEMQRMQQDLLLLCAVSAKKLVSP